MKLQKLVLATSVCAALSGVSGVANADILGVPGEALLVTPMVADPATPGVETYIALRVPLTIGSDTVINNYTAPNTTTEGTVTTQSINDPRVYWTIFDENSVKVEDGTCEVSPGDAVLWTTDPAAQLTEAVQRAGLVAAGIIDRPNPVCGPSNPSRFGYVVFQTISAADGLVADFAFTADASISLDGFASDVGVPVVPMADGADPLPSASGFPVFKNEVIAGGAYANGTPSSPVRYAPIVSGIRFGLFDDLTDRVTQMPITGPASGFGIAAHVYWFNINQAGRDSFIDLYDDMEGQCSIRLPVPRELNIWAYNTFGNRASGTAPSWANVGALTPNVGYRVTDLITWVNGAAYTSSSYCAPTYFAFDPVSGYIGSLVGYAENWIPGYAYAGQPNDGNEHTAGLQYALLQNVGTGFWTGHLATDIGMQ